MTVKRRPHHPLETLKAKFASVETLEITTSALRGADALGYDLEAVVAVVQQLERDDFIKSELLTIRAIIESGTTAIGRRSTGRNSI